MERMIKDLQGGESCIFANDTQEYYDFVGWLDDKGAVFAYHFGSGEAFLFNGNTVEVYGL